MGDRTTGIRRISDIVRGAQRRQEAQQRKGAERKAKRQEGPAARGQRARRVRATQTQLRGFLNRQGVGGLGRGAKNPINAPRTKRRGGRTVARPDAFKPAR